MKQQEIKIIGLECAAVIKYVGGYIALPTSLVESLPMAVKNIITAKGTPTIGDFSQDELDEKLTSLLAGLHQDAGQIIDGKDLSVFVYRLSRELNDMRFLHFGELEESCRQGLRGLYGNNFGINLMAVLRWIDGYKSTPEYRQYAYEISKLIDRTSKIKVPTDAEKDVIAKDLALLTFKNYTEGKDIDLQAVTVYDHLDDKKVIVFSSDQKKVFFDKAHENVKKYLSWKASRTDNKSEASELKRQIIDVGKHQNGEPETMTNIERTNLLLKNEAKRIALKSFFDSLIEFEQPLNI